MNNKKYIFSGFKMPFQLLVAYSKRSSKIQFLSAMGLLLLLITAFSSCEKEVNIKLKPGSEKVVVEGTIEVGQPPFILLTKTIGFFSRIDENTLADIFLHDAVITVSNNSQTITLREYNLNFGGAPYYFYSIDSADAQSFNFKGAFGETYNLKITYNGKDYTSSTTIPYCKPLDSMWAKAPIAEELPEGQPNAMLLYARYTDPDTMGNRVRFFTKRNKEGFLTSLFSTYDDNLVNGTTVDIGISAGFNKSDSFDRSTYGYFFKGDTVIVKWSSIDKSVFDFWRTLEFSTLSTGNPFASPVEVSTNITGGALGVWAGYGSTYDTLIIAP